MSTDVKILAGEINVDYKWNPGPVVGRFLTSMRDDGELVAIRCTKTSKVYLPPQSWSPYGMIRMERFVPVSGAPTLKAGTVVYQAPWNAPEDVPLPYMLAAIAYPGMDSELIHIVVAERAKLESLQPGARLKAVWKEERTGTIRDLLYYQPED